MQAHRHPGAATTGFSERAARIVFAGAVALHVVMFLSLFFGYLNPLFDNSDNFPQAIDFFSIYRGGTFFLRGDSIYSWSAVDSVPYSAPFRYVPFFAYTVGVAFNVLPPWTGYWLWVSLIEVMIAGCAWLTFRLADDRRWGLIAAATWYAFTPVYLELYMGQWSFLMATLMLVTAAGLMAGRTSLSSVPWIASLLVKSNSAMLAPIYLAQRQWRILVIAAVAVLVLNGPYFLFYHDDLDLFLRMNFGGYYGSGVEHRLLNSASGDMGGIAYLRSIWFAFDETAQALPKWLARSWSILVVGGSLAATLLPRRMHIPSVFSIWLCTYFLVYGTWEHHYVMLLPALALLIARDPEHRALAIMAFVLTAVPTPYVFFERYLSDRPPTETFLSPENYWPHWAAILHHGMKAVPVFVLWATLAGDRIYEWVQSPALETTATPTGGAERSAG